jgi:hypothetical protein
MDLNKPKYVNKYTLEIYGQPASIQQIEEWVRKGHNLELVTGNVVLHWYPSRNELVMGVNQSLANLCLQPEGYEVTVEAVEL